MIKNYFGKDWKFFWITSPVWKVIVRKPSTYFGLKLLTLSRFLLKIGRERCSYCGAEQNRYTGLHMHITKKGMRCGNTPVSCCDK